MNKLILILAAVLLTAACESGPASKTTVDRVLLAAKLENAPYSNVLVVGATPRRETDRMIEEGLIKELRARDVVAYSFVRSSASTRPSEEAVAQLVREKNADGVIVVSARFDRADIRQHDEQVSVDARPKQGGLLDFFRYDYKEVASPRYSSVTVDVKYVADFYDTESQKRVYSAESATAHGKTDYEIVMAESKAIVARLKKDGLIR